MLFIFFDIRVSEKMNENAYNFVKKLKIYVGACIPNMPLEFSSFRICRGW